MADERDPRVSRRYRELPGEEPSRELDQHILAAAHRAAGSPHAPLVAPAGRHRWYYSLAAAAVLVLAVAVTLHVERQQPDPEALSTQPAPQAAKEEMARQKLAEQKVATQEPASAPPPARAQRDAAERTRAAPAARPQAPPRFTPEPTPQAPSPAARADTLGAASGPANTTASREVQDMQVERRAQSGAAQSIAARSAPAPASAQSPERELERIAELRRLGRDDEADKALADFRKRYPDYRISAETRAKVERPAPAR